MQNRPSSPPILRCRTRLVVSSGFQLLLQVNLSEQICKCPHKKYRKSYQTVYLYIHWTTAAAGDVVVVPRQCHRHDPIWAAAVRKSSMNVDAAADRNTDDDDGMVWTTRRPEGIVLKLHTTGATGAVAVELKK